MTRLEIKFFTLLFVSFLIWFLIPAETHAAKIRKPVWSGQFYPAQAGHLRQMINTLTQQAQKTPFKIPAAKNLKALIMPHAGYIYSGLTAAHVSRVLNKNQFRKVILMAPDHRIGFSNGMISDVDAYQTPLGRIQLHSEASGLRKSSPLFGSNAASDQKEHAVEVILPFLQHYLKRFQLIPMVLGPCHIGKMAHAITPYLDSKALIVASSDLSHFLPYQQAVERDTQTIQTILNLQAEKLAKIENSACGKVPILVLIRLARRFNWQPVLLHYTNSGDTAGGRSRVVGYTAIAFYGGNTMQNNDAILNPQQGQALVKLARHTLMQRLCPDQDNERLISDALNEACFQKQVGTFVTLKKKGALRGCIGNLTASESILESVKRNAISAAFQDPRFPPLKARELDQIDIEISILTEPQPLAYTDSVDLLSKLRVDIDGVIIRHGGASATFLPQVWEQLPRKEDFLNHLCQKAGLTSDMWRTSKLKVLTYQVQYFDEEK